MRFARPTIRTHTILGIPECDLPSRTELVPFISFRLCNLPDAQLLQTTTLGTRTNPGIETSERNKFRATEAPLPRFYWSGWFDA